jgi:hypothetical protein
MRPVLLNRGLVTAAALLLVGCASGPGPLYGWGPYPQALTQYLRATGGDAARQAALLEEQLQRNAAGKRANPPGLHAHLALLHTQLGNEETALRHLEAEKKLFPESTAYMDFLLRSARSARAQAEGSAPAPATAASGAVR